MFTEFLVEFEWFFGDHIAGFVDGFTVDKETDKLSWAFGHILKQIVHWQSNENKYSSVASEIIIALCKLWTFIGSTNISFT